MSPGPNVAADRNRGKRRNRPIERKNRVKKRLTEVFLSADALVTLWKDTCVPLLPDWGEKGIFQHKLINRSINGFICIVLEC